MAVFAPAGYGKTTLLAQASELDGRRFGWISLEDADNDPVVLAAHLAQALSWVSGVDPTTFGAVSNPPHALWSTTLPRLRAAFNSIEHPMVVVLDDVHVLCERDACDVLTAICDYIPAGSRLMFAGRHEPQRFLARVRAERRVADLQVDDLALDVVEAGSLLRAAGVTLTEQEIAELTAHTEGWAVSIYLTALSLRETGTRDRHAGLEIGGTPRQIADYIQLEVLSGLPPDQVEFLTRTAVLDRMCGPLCDAVLKQTGSAAILESLQQSNRLLVALDRRGEWYRYHHLFRDLLARELDLREPDVIPTLNRRAADWSEDNGAREAAIAYALAGDDVKRAATLVAVCAIPAHQAGRLETVRKWIERLSERGAPRQYPAVAVLGAWCEGLSGHPAEAERWAMEAKQGDTDQPAPDGGATIEPWVRCLEAAMCRHGVDRMRIDAERALELSPSWSLQRPVASNMLGIALLLAGDSEQADQVFSDNSQAAKELDMPSNASVALAQRSLLAAADGDLDTAEKLAQDAERCMLERRFEAYLPSATTFAALGRVALHRGELQQAQTHLAGADRLRPLLTYFMPFNGVQVRLELVRARIALGDAAGAMILQREIDQLVRRVPDLGVLVGQAGELRDRVNAMHALTGDWTPLLTEAELQVLPLLTTHLTIAEIAERRYVSRATIKTQAVSIYRKLEVTKRSEAIERAAKLGLIDSLAVPRSRDFTRSG